MCEQEKGENSADCRGNKRKEEGKLGNKTTEKMRQNLNKRVKGEDTAECRKKSESLRITYK